MLKNISIATATTFGVIFGLTCLTTNAAEVTLRGASCFPIGSPPSKPFEGVVKGVNAAGKGVVQIKLIGVHRLSAARLH